MKKIYIRSPQWLGDAVVSTAFLHALRAREADAAITVLAPSYLLPIFAAHPARCETLALPYSSGGTIFDTARLIRENRFDEAYVLPRSFRTALEVYLGKIPKRVGFSGDGRKFFLTHALSYNAHLAYPNRYLKLIDLENLPADSIQLYFPTERLSKKTAADIGIETENIAGPILGIAPVSIAPSRTWLAERFAEVANQFQKKNGGTIILFGSAKEQPAISALAAKIQGPVLNTAGKLSLPELGGLLKQCQQLVANDSGLMHVAAALKVPTVVLFGASDPTYALPRTGKFVSIQHKEISCVPCLRNHCVRLGDAHNACQKAITRDEVLHAISQL